MSDRGIDPIDLIETILVEWLVGTGGYCNTGRDSSPASSCSELACAAPAQPRRARRDGTRPMESSQVTTSSREGAISISHGLAHHRPVPTRASTFLRQLFSNRMGGRSAGELPTAKIVGANHYLMPDRMGGRSGWDRSVCRASPLGFLETRACSKKNSALPHSRSSGN